MVDDPLLRQVLGVVDGIRQSLAEVPAKRGRAEAVRAATVVPESFVSPSVFISWAHQDPASGAAEAKAWASAVLTFAVTLRRLGIDADLDLFHVDESVDWTRFGPRRIAEADRVIVVMSGAWAARHDGSNDPHVGAGAAKEADVLHGLYSRDQSEWQQKLAIVMFPQISSTVVPLSLDRVARVSVDPSNESSYEPLARLLTRQPSYPKPPLGALRRYESLVPPEAIE